MKIEKPKYKIGDCVIAKGWFFENLFLVEGGFWDDNEKDWKYTLGRKNNGWFSVKHCRQEREIRNLNLEW